jgi:hypothetical protein
VTVVKTEKAVVALGFILKARFAQSSLIVYVSNPFEPVTLFSTAKNRVTRKMPPLLKFLTAKNSLF